MAYVIYVFIFFLFKQKTAYEMRISDWSSDVCSSDLQRFGAFVEEDALGDLKLELSGCDPRRRDRVQDRRGQLFIGELARRDVDRDAVAGAKQIGRASCRERVCQYV